MRFSAMTFAAIAVAVLSGCVVAPVGVRPGYGGGPVQVEPEYVVPPGVIYIAPTYALPAPGYYWRHHRHYGWGWRHGSRGWHRGWR